MINGIDGMEKKLNSGLYSSEVVHHIDGNKKNNSVENLIVLDKKNHDSLHSNTDKVVFELLSLGIIKFDKQNIKYYIASDVKTNNMPISLGFENVAITQNKNKCSSRLDADIKSEVIRGVKLDVPMIASNMSTVSNAEFCILLSKLGSMGVMHRAASDDHICSEVRKIAKECEWVAASVGNGHYEIDLVDKLVAAGANILFIDIAHGYSDQVINFGKTIKKVYPHVKLVLGNTTNENMLYEVYEFADALKVGIAQGFACETKNTAGCTEKQFSAISKFKNISKEFGIPIISDGGTREPADLVKAIGAGANSIMAGKIFAACPESAAEIIEEPTGAKKIYAGMASRYVQERWKGKMKTGTCPEGGVRYLEIGESAEKLLERYAGALRSGITYAGATKIDDFQENVKFVRIL